MTDKKQKNGKISDGCLITKVIRQKPPPGTLRQTWCEVCGGWYMAARCPFEDEHRRLRQRQSK